MVPDPRRLVPAHGRKTYKLAISHHDRALWWRLSAQLEISLREMGRHRCAKHSGRWSVGRQVMALYFRTIEDGQTFVAAFPELELADGVGR